AGLDAGTLRGQAAVSRGEWTESPVRAPDELWALLASAIESPRVGGGIRAGVRSPSGSARLAVAPAAPSRSVEQDVELGVLDRPVGVDMRVRERASRRAFMAFNAFFAFRAFFAGWTFFARRTGDAFLPARTFLARAAGSAVFATRAFLSGRPGFAGLALQRPQHLRAYLLGRVDQVVLGRERAAA